MYILMKIQTLKKKWDGIYVVICGVASGKFEIIGKPIEFDALRQINSRFN